MNRILAILLGGVILIGTAMYFADHQNDLSMLHPTDQGGNHSTLVCKVLDCTPEN